ncbi:uncharacterized protein [Haliotis cracherodii]|uniref:uncharacterized protein n=1 Tax=Haliotis cracherodii TaxID=6455 RepID=UPI0039E8959F
MEKGQIVTHAKSDSSRVVLNNRVYENISNATVGTSATEIENHSANAFTKRKNLRFESGQDALVPRQCRNVNQREQILFNTLEKHLSRQQQSALQSQDHSMQKYRQRLAGYVRLRMPADESINGSCVGASSGSEVVIGSERRPGSKTISGKSTHASISTYAVKHGDQSIATVDVNTEKEAGPGVVTNAPAERAPSVYNTANSTRASQSNDLGGRSVSQDFRGKLPSQKKSKSFRTLESVVKKIHSQKKIGLKISMLRAPDSSGCTSTDSNLLTVDDNNMRPRAYTDPTSDGKGKMAIKLPEITIEDCSDPEDKTNSEVEMFSDFSQPRRRANTCPEEFFNRRRKGRPPTPPPTSRNSSPNNKFTFGSARSASKSPVSFVHHKLSKVFEDGGEAPSGGNVSKKSSARMSKQTNVNRRSSFNTMASLRAGLDSKLTLIESEDEMSRGGDIPPPRAGNGPFAVTKPEASRASDNNKISGYKSQGQEVPDVYSAKDCRFSQKISPTLDGKPLQAC